METADLLLAYDWPYDEPFLARLGRSLRAAGRSLVVVNPQAVENALSRVRRGDLAARTFLDRGADTNAAFEPLEAWAAEHVPVVLNGAIERRRAWRKSNLHWEFIRAGVHAPQTLVVPALNRQPILEVQPDLTPLGLPFAIKPDVGGGGWGVTLGGRSWEQVEQARCEMPDDDLLLQELIEPHEIDGRRGWFRIFYACGEVIPCWWDDRTRLFGPMVTADERRSLGLDGLWWVAGIAAMIGRLQLFSTEAARLADGRWAVVDYVNDPVDLRILTQAGEGMPVEAADRIVAAVTAFIERQV